MTAWVLHIARANLNMLPSGDHDLSPLIPLLQLYDRLVSVSISLAQTSRRGYAEQLL
jgi:hypothetical protein